MRNVADCLWWVLFYYYLYRIYSWICNCWSCCAFWYHVNKSVCLAAATCLVLPLVNAPTVRSAFWMVRFRYTSATLQMIASCLDQRTGLRRDSGQWFHGLESARSVSCCMVGLTHCVGQIWSAFLWKWHQYQLQWSRPDSRFCVRVFDHNVRRVSVFFSIKWSDGSLRVWDIYSNIKSILW